MYKGIFDSIQEHLSIQPKASIGDLVIRGGCYLRVGWSRMTWAWVWARAGAGARA